MKRIVSVILAVIMLSSFAATLSVSASPPPDLEYLIKDPALLAIIREALGKGPEDNVNTAEAEEIVSLSVNSPAVTSLEGIEWLYNLKNLTVCGTSVTSIDYERDTTSAIRIFSNSELRSVNIKNTRSLRSLEVTENPKLTEVSVSNAPDLSAADFSRNALTSLSLSELPALEKMYCADNRLKSLDLTGCPSISEFYWDNNNIVSHYGVKVPESSDYHERIENAPASPYDIIVKVDVRNPDVRNMTFNYMYSQKGIGTQVDGPNGPETVGSVWDFRDSLGFNFTADYAKLVNPSKNNGEYAPGEYNDTFVVRLKNIDVRNALRSLVGNEYLVYAGPDCIVDSDGAGEPTGLPFRDVKSSDWFIGNVRYVYNMNLMTGEQVDRFVPDDAVTRAMAVTVLYRNELRAFPAGFDSPGAAFGDVPHGSWFDAPVGWAKTRGITFGKTDTLFDPDGAVTRAEFAAMLYRYFKSMGGLSTFAKTDDAVPSDMDRVPDYAKEAAAALFSAGIVKGRPGGIFDPDATITRAEAAALIERFNNGVFRDMGLEQMPGLV